MEFAQSLKGPQLPPSYHGLVIADPLHVIPKGGFPRPVHFAHDFPHFLRPINSRAPISMTAKQAQAVLEVNMSGRGIEVIPPGTFDPFPCLQTLWLSDNRLSALAGLGPCRRVKRFFAANNRVASLSPEHGCELAAMAHLQELDLASNDLAHLASVLRELQRLPFLAALTLQGCPCANEADYRLRVLACLPQLHLLDHRVVGQAERQLAAQRYGQDKAQGAVALAAQRQARRAAALEAASTALLTATARGSAATLGSSSRSTAAPVRSDGLVEQGHETGRGGLGRLPLPLPHPSIVFGQGHATPSSTRLQAKARAAAARAKWDAAERAAIAAQFSREQQQHGSQWSATIDHGMFDSSSEGSSSSSSSSSSSAPTAAAGPLLATSALINSTQAAGAEDLITRRVRDGMLRRGVDPALLSETGGARRRMLESGDLQAAFLTALAPAVPAVHASALVDAAGLTILPPSASPSKRAEGGSSSSASSSGAGSATASSSLSRSLRQLGGASGARSDLAHTLSAAAGAAGLHPLTHSHSALRDSLVEASGMRTSLRPLPSAGLRRTGVLPSGAPNPAAAGAVSAALGRDSGGSGSQGAFTSADGGPLLPAIGADGSLGHWDRFRLMCIFKAADNDGSGELSIEEIRTCITSAADYGFCVSLEAAQSESSGGGGGSSGAGAAAAAGGGGRVDEPLESSRAATPAGLSGSTALLGTASAAGRLAVEGAARRLNELLVAVFQVLDVDGSGTISWREFSQALDGQQGAAAAREAGIGGKGEEAAGSASASAAARSSLPRLAFRPLTGEECSARANRHFAVARATYEKLQRVENSPLPAAALQRADPAAAAAAASAHAVYVREACARLGRDAAAAGEKAVRLHALGRALGGSYDPPEVPQPPPRPRSDYFCSSLLLPATVAAGLGARGGGRRSSSSSSARLPLPGAELVADDLAALRVLHPTQNQVEEELEDAEVGGSKGRDREAAAAGLLRTLQDEAWERFRGLAKSRAQHSLLRRDVRLEGARE